ncbi:MAG: hypothetical protein K9W43_01485 [Candidatus Thorarchaeota archaeon]|nr:hypothetical protein [Candidatus Thorarchaeota archaeon]
MSQRVTGQLTKRQLQELRRLELVKHELDKLRKKGIDADIPICPVCKSPRLVLITSYYDLGYLGSLQPAYYCIDCGWYGRTLTIMTNRPENDAILEDMKEAFGDDTAMVDATATCDVEETDAESKRNRFTNYTY